MKKKGFTLMEVLFVLLIVALVASFAVPAIRSVRYDVRNSQAKTALKKLLAARRSFYQNTKGGSFGLEPSFQAKDAQSFAAVACLQASTGIPPTKDGRLNSDINQLFACGYLNWKDFASLPYTFFLCNPQTATAGTCQIKDNKGEQIAAYAMVDDVKLAGKKYEYLSDGSTLYYMAVGWDGQIYENLE